ncbi:hypothetical protein RN001_005651 [Aquatica leii]|uniref:THAP-type domain-containing protein n=1 Tax=Aquatica leii TaxID=1421715 RepID=A0AAN7SHY6_9COLE|nr:hypothetical protein RN001_005651 [Aquatica leii]
MSKPQNKWCFVRGCILQLVLQKNCFPQDHSRKMKWFRATRRDVPKSKSMFFCCEDHFNLEEDIENYIRFKLLGGNIFLKSGVILHIFDCQPDRKRDASAPERSLPLKMKRRRLMEEVLIIGSETDEHVFTVCDENVKSVGVQVKPLYRSKYVSCNIQAKSVIQLPRQEIFL